MVFLISIAQIFCWIGIITQDPSYNAIEESLWTIFGFTIFVIYSVLYLNINNFNQTLKIKKLKSIIPIILISTLLYILFMTLNDVPMYIKRAKQSKDKNVQYNNLMDGIQSMKKCKKATSSFKEWKEDIPWLSLYFTLSVWGSIYILKWVEKYQKLR